jgi:hypothetical protein
VWATQLAHQDADRIINKQVRFFTARALPSRSRDLSRLGQNELKKIKRMSESSFVCQVCKQTHEGIPLSFAADFPDMYANMPDAEHSSRALISSDQCIIDDTWFFIRGCLEIPVIETGEVFLWGVWASVKEEVFNELSESWEETGRETRRGPFKGRLANSLSVYPETLNLKLRLIVQPVGQRPLFVIEEEHALTTAQQHGMSQHEVAELGHILVRIHGGSSRSSQ